MEIKETILKTITPKEGYLLTDGEVTTNVLFVRDIPAEGAWWEIPDPDYIPELDGTDYLRPMAYVEGMEIITGLWYSDGSDIWEAIKNGVPKDFTDRNYFEIIG